MTSFPAFPIDLSALPGALFTLTDVTADRGRDGVQRSRGEGKDARPVWTTSVAWPSEIEGRAPSVLTVKIASLEKPAIFAMTPVQFSALSARVWQLDNGTVGVTLMTDGVTAL